MAHFRLRQKQRRTFSTATLNYFARATSAVRTIWVKPRNHTFLDEEWSNEEWKAKLSGCYAVKWLVCVCDLFVPFVCYLSRLFATCPFSFVTCLICLLLVACCLLLVPFCSPYFAQNINVEQAERLHQAKHMSPMVISTLEMILYICLLRHPPSHICTRG